jgi:hypothetical protein
VRIPELSKSGLSAILSLTEAFLHPKRRATDYYRPILQIIGQYCKSQHYQPGNHKLVRYPMHVLVLLRNSLQGRSDKYSDDPCHKE